MGVRYRKLNIVNQDLNLNLNVRYEGLDKAKSRPQPQAFNAKGEPVYERNILEGRVLQPGDLQRLWVDEQGQAYAKSELVFKLDGEEVREIETSQVYEITGFQPESNYTDTYVISKYYEIFPDDNDKKKDIDRQIAKSHNLRQMYQLWKYLKENHVVGRGELCTSSRGFYSSDGYVRAIEIEGKWGLEIGVFKEAKIFEHLNEGTPEEISLPQVSAGKAKRLKMI